MHARADATASQNMQHEVGRAKLKKYLQSSMYTELTHLGVINCIRSFREIGRNMETGNGGGEIARGD